MLLSYKNTDTQHAFSSKMSKDLRTPPVPRTTATTYLASRPTTLMLQVHRKRIPAGLIHIYQLIFAQSSEETIPRAKSPSDPQLLTSIRARQTSPSNHAESHYGYWKSGLSNMRWQPAGSNRPRTMVRCYIGRRTTDATVHPHRLSSLLGVDPFCTNRQRIRSRT